MNYAQPTQLLADQRVLIFGGSGRMGRSIAKHVLNASGMPVLVGRDEQKLAAAAAALGLPGEGRSWLVGDVGDPHQVDALFQEAGRVDHVVTPTSSSGPGAMPPAASIDQVELAVFKQVFDRLWAGYNALHFAARHLDTGGSVTLDSGASARRSTKGFGIYGALHGAIEALARAAAVELAPIRVNVVSPGSLGAKPMRQLAHHFGQYDDLGSAVVTLLANPAIAAAVLDVDGGESLGDWNGEAIPDRK